MPAPLPEVHYHYLPDLGNLCAVSAPSDPALLEYVNYGLCRTSAFPLLPGKEVRVAVHYTDVCKKDGDPAEVFYPLNTEKFSSRPIDEVQVKVDVLGKGAISAVYSPNTL